MLRRALFVLLVASHVFFFCLILVQYDQLSSLFHVRSEAADTSSGALHHSIHSITPARTPRAAEHYTAFTSSSSTSPPTPTFSVVPLLSSPAKLLPAPTSAPTSATSTSARSSTRPSATSAVSSAETTSAARTTFAGRTVPRVPVLLLSLVPSSGHLMFPDAVVFARYVQGRFPLLRDRLSYRCSSTSGQEL